jgi:hypothetical protein
MAFSSAQGIEQKAIRDLTARKEWISRSSSNIVSTAAAIVCAERH